MSRMASSSSTMSTLGIGVGLRYRYSHEGPYAALGAYRDLAAHPLHELLADRQPEAKAARGIFAWRIEAFEEVGEILLRYASGLVLDGHRRPGDKHSHLLARIRVLDRIGYGDQERLLEQRGVGDDPCPRALDDHVEPRALGQGFRDLRRSTPNTREVDRFQLGLPPTPADAGELEEGVREPSHPLGPGEYVPQEAAAGDGIVVSFRHQELCGEGDRGERGAQFVGRVGEELLLGLLESATLREVLHHDQHAIRAAVAQLRYVLELDPQEGLPSPHAGFPALPLQEAGGDGLAQVEVLPRARELPVLFADAEHGPPSRVGEDHPASRVGRDHALGEVVQDRAERRVLFG